MLRRGRLQSVCLMLILSFLSISNQTTIDEEALLLMDAKHGLDDPTGAIADWDPQHSSPCNWTGITCSPSSSSPSTTTITAVKLSARSLTGEFPSSLCHLPSLSLLSLSSNNLNSSIPSKSLLPCSSLSSLDLSQNLFVGPLPDSLSSLPLLTYLDLSGNNFSGEIPAAFAAFPRLRELSLVANLLTGQLPAFLSNISSLRQLNLSYNPFSPGPIPSSFASLSSLQTLWLAGCSLVGPIPPELGDLAQLENLDISINNLSGSIPSSLVSLSSAVQIELYSNALTGSIPAGFSNISSLRRIDFSMNALSGSIPGDLFDAPNLESVHLYENRLNGPIPASVARSKTISDVRLFSNQIDGPIPPGFGESSPLVFVDLANNSISGEIPQGICAGGVLEELLLLDNELSGNLPESLGHCRTLSRVRLANNRLSGEVPSDFWGLPHVSLLELAGNSFSGRITASIAGARNLSKLLISDNHFNGSIPPEIGALSSLYEFSASNNELEGSLPLELGSLVEIGKLDLQNNSLSGFLLKDIDSWKKLSDLNLANNNFSGSIPSELGNLPVLNYLDLSGNKLAGVVPVELQNLKLNHFNLSDNPGLSGPLPPLFLSSTYKDSFLGNPAICFSNLNLCSPSSKLSFDHSTHERRMYRWFFNSIFILSGVILLAGVSWFFRKYQRFERAKRKSNLEASRWTLTSFHKRGFSELEIVESLDEDNVIGSGASGKVYKVVLSDGEAVAVKKMPAVAIATGDNSYFASEVSTLGKVRHKNIVKLWCCCTHKDCKLLVYEFMPNGSLGDLLHGAKSSQLDWPARLKIMVDAAEGLSYLHHDCSPPIVHRDVKSNNILLDADYGAKVADFGLAKPIEQEKKSMSAIAGSCGYIAPEYAYTLRVNERSDIYSFGVVMLELITGKLPVDPDLGDKDLAKWVCATSDLKGPEHVIDQKLFQGLSSFKEEIYKALDVALLCTSSLPINRPSMRVVVKMLLEISGPAIAGQRRLETAKSTKKLSVDSYCFYEEDDVSDPGGSELCRH